MVKTASCLFSVVQAAESIENSKLEYLRWLVMTSRTMIRTIMSDVTSIITEKAFDDRTSESIMKQNDRIVRRQLYDKDGVTLADTWYSPGGESLITITADEQFVHSDVLNPSYKYEEEELLKIVTLITKSIKLPGNKCNCAECRANEYVF